MLTLLAIMVLIAAIVVRWFVLALVALVVLCLFAVDAVRERL